MKLQLYPTIKSEAYEPKETQVDPVIKLIDEFFKKPIDTDKDKCYNNYIK